MWSSLDEIDAAKIYKNYNLMKKTKWSFWNVENTIWFLYFLSLIA